MKSPLHWGREVQNGGGGEAGAPLLSIVPRDPPPPQSPDKGSNTHTQCKPCAWKIPGSGVPPPRARSCRSPTASPAGCGFHSNGCRPPTALPADKRPRGLMRGRGRPERGLPISRPLTTLIQVKCIFRPGSVQGRAGRVFCRRPESPKRASDTIYPAYSPACCSIP